MSERRRVREGRRRPVAVVAALATMMGTASSGVTEEARREFPFFGMSGLAPRQVAVLSLVDVGSPDSGRAACRVTAAFVDGRGQVFRDAAGNAVQDTFVLRPNVAATLQLRSPDILGERELRTPMRVVLMSPPDDGTRSDCTCLVAGLEVVNRSGKVSSSDYGTASGGGPNPPPPPPICEQFVSPGGP